MILFVPRVIGSDRVDALSIGRGEAGPWAVHVVGLSPGRGRASGSVLCGTGLDFYVAAFGRGSKILACGVPLPSCPRRNR